jgi:hypothetical protein
MAFFQNRTVPFSQGYCPLFVVLHDGAIPFDVSEHDRGQLSLRSHFENFMSKLMNPGQESFVASPAEAFA